MSGLSPQFPRPIGPENSKPAGRVWPGTLKGHNDQPFPSPKSHRAPSRNDSSQHNPIDGLFWLQLEQRFQAPIRFQAMTPIPLLALLLVTALPAAAQLPLTAEEAAKLAREKNPELSAARNLIAEAQGRSRVSGRLSNPELGAEVAGGQEFEGRVSIGITQSFPLTARLRMERNLSNLEVEMARLEIQDRERRIMVAARTSLYELAAARQAIALARRQTVVAAAFAKSIDEGNNQGFGSKLDGQHAALAADTLRTTEEALRSQEIIAAARLNGLLGGQPDAALSVTESLDLPPALPAMRPVGARADLQLAEMSVRAGATDVSLAKANRWEEVGIGLFVEGERFRDEPEGIEPEALIGVQFSVPLPFWQNGAGKVAEKQAAQMRKAQQLEALALAVRNEAITAHQLMSARYRTAARITDKLIPAALQHLADSEAAYGRAELDIQRVFLARERLAELESAALEARKNYFLSYSEWLGTLGETPAKP